MSFYIESNPCSLNESNSLREVFSIIITSPVREMCFTIVGGATNRKLGIPCFNFYSNFISYAFIDFSSNFIDFFLNIFNNNYLCKVSKASFFVTFISFNKKISLKYVANTYSKERLFKKYSLKYVMTKFSSQVQQII